MLNTALRQQTEVKQKPYDAVFISDLHLHPGEEQIFARFKSFVAWAAKNTEKVYILGDFFHVWPGDDAVDHWSLKIAELLQGLAQQQVKIYYMHGNRDFLLGKQFADSAAMTILPEPSLIQLGQRRVLLVHGDRYCLEDKAHQCFRKLTRNRWFSKLFLLLPLPLRIKMVATVRNYSQSNTKKKPAQMDVVVQAMLEHMQQYRSDFLIHGHTHKPGLTEHRNESGSFFQYVLSDWDDSPQLLCYDKTERLYFILFESLEEFCDEREKR